MCVLLKLVVSAKQQLENFVVLVQMKFVEIRLFFTNLDVKFNLD